LSGYWVRRHASEASPSTLAMCSLMWGSGGQVPGIAPPGLYATFTPRAVPRGHALRYPMRSGTPSLDARFCIRWTRPLRTQQHHGRQRSRLHRCQCLQQPQTPTTPPDASGTNNAPGAEFTRLATSSGTATLPASSSDCRLGSTISSCATERQPPAKPETPTFTTLRGLLTYEAIPHMTRTCRCRALPPFPLTNRSFLAVQR
jgi:hypothetical protein